MDSLRYLRDCAGIVPLLVLFITGILILLVDAFASKGQKDKASYVALLGIAVGLLSLLWPLPADHELFSGMLYADTFTVFFHAVLMLGTFMMILLSMGTLEKEHFKLSGEYYALLLFSTMGMMMMVQAAHFIMVFLGLEVLSISIYILVGVFRDQSRSNEASLKYFLLGAFSSGFLLYGLTFLYGATGSLSLSTMATFLSDKSEWLRNTYLLIGTALVLVGFSFKMALVPFHMWTPDVYEGAPTPITAYMAVAVKAAVFASLARIFWMALPTIQPYWIPVLWVLSVVTMMVGNITALVQDNVKRMLAYSSIAHAGYILMALVAVSDNGLSGMLIYLLAYTFMNVGAFGVVIVLQDRFGMGENVADYRGLGMRYPFLGAVMTLFLFSLAGIPPTAGFVAKFFVFGAVIQAGQIWLAVIGVLNSVVAVYYYLRLVVNLYSRPSEEMEAAQASLKVPAVALGALILAAWATLQIGILPNTFWELAKRSVYALL